MQERATEDGYARRLDVGRGCGSHFEVHELTLANNDCIKRFVVVLDVEIGYTSDELAVERKKYICFLEALAIVATVDLADHEELMALWILAFYTLNPFYE